MHPLSPRREMAASERKTWFIRWCLGAIVAAIVLLVLIQASYYLIPLAIAILVFSLASAVIDRILQIRLGSVRIPNWLASACAVLLVGAVLIGLFAFASAQFNTVLATVPVYVERGQVVIARLFALLGEDVAHAMLTAFQEINLNAYVRAAAGSAGNLLGATLLTILYVGFLFTERPWFDAKIAKLFPGPERTRQVHAIVSSIRHSVHHYLLVKTGVSALTGLAVYVILRLFGLDFAEMLAVLTFLLNFIPNLGSLIATALPVLVALVQFATVPPALAVLASVGIIQFMLGNIVDPMLMGRALQMSTFGIVISLILWGAIWGIVGMFLAVPIMVMVMIVCAHIPLLRPIAILLSRDGDPLGANGETPEMPGR